MTTPPIKQYHQAIVRAVESGCNVIDSAINYRLSEKRTLHRHGAQRARRPKATTATKSSSPPKAASFPTTARRPRMPRSYIEEDIYQARPRQRRRHRQRLPLHDAEIFAQSTRLQPAQSRPRMHRYLLRAQSGNPAGKNHPRRIRPARWSKHSKRWKAPSSAGKIRMYGTATWNGFRNEADAKDYLSLAQVVGLAEKAGGKNHHFKVIQLPLNLGMSEALSNANQPAHGDKAIPCSKRRRSSASPSCAAPRCCKAN